MIQIAIPRCDGKKLFKDKNYRDWYDEMTKNIWGYVWDSLKSGRSLYVYFDSADSTPDYIRRFVIHASAKNAGYLQYTSMTYWGSEDPIMNYDEQYANRERFLHGMHDNGITLNLEEV